MGGVEDKRQRSESSLSDVLPDDILSSSSNSNHFTSKELQKQISSLQASCLQATRKVDEYLRNPKHRKTFVEGSSFETMEKFHEGVLELLGLVEKICGLGACKQNW